MPALEFFVPGIPVTQGNKTAFVTRDGKRAVMREGGSSEAYRRFGSWRHAVSDEARAAVRGVQGSERPLEGPVSLVVAFGLLRPASAPKRTRTWPVKARSGDIDKLARAVLDAITGVLIADDAQVVSLRATKDYGIPGVWVRLEPVEES